MVSAIRESNNFIMHSRKYFGGVVSVCGKHLLAGLLLIGFPVFESHAATLYWNTGGTSATWTSANWGSSTSGPFTTAWTSGSDVDFSAASSITYVTATLIGNLTVDSGVAVTVTGAGTMSAGTHTFDIGSGSTLTWTSQNVSTGSASNFTKNGAGTWNIGAQGNAYTGSFTLNAGTVIVSGNNSFGGSGSALTINGGIIQSSSTRVFAPASIAIGGDFGFSGTGNASFSGAVALGSTTRTITNSQTSGSLIFSGVVSGSGGLALSGTGTMALSGANTYTGDTTINSGTVQLGNGGTTGTLVTSASIINNGTFAINRTNAVVQGTDFSSSAIAGTGAFIQAGTGTTTLNLANTYTGPTTVNAGTLILAAGGSIASTSYTIASAGIFNVSAQSSYSLSGIATTIGVSATSAGQFIGPAGALTLSGGTLTFNFSTTLASGTYTIFTAGSTSGDFTSVAATGGIVSTFSRSGSVWTNDNQSAGILSFDESTGVLSVTVSAIPEPATYALLASAAALLGAVIYRRRQVKSV